MGRVKKKPYFGGICMMSENYVFPVDAEDKFVPTC
jgi:hypothetical protein